MAHGWLHFLRRPGGEPSGTVPAPGNAGGGDTNLFGGER